MTAVDRLAAIIAAHRLQGGLDRYRCTCGAATAKGLGARAWRERHLAAVSLPVKPSPPCGSCTSVGTAAAAARAGTR